MKPVLYAVISLALGIISPMSLSDTKIDIDTPPMLSKLESEGGVIHKKFKVSDHLNGFAITVGMDQLIVYATADGKHIVNGSLLNENAEDLTPDFADKYIPKPDTGNVVAKLEASKFFETHDPKGSRQLYVFHDPNCGYCKKAWETIMPYEYKKGLAIRWIPVGALGKNSIEKAAALLASEAPKKLQDDFDRGYRLGQKELTETSVNSQDVVNNTKLMSFLRLSGTPSMVLVEDGKVLKIIKGFKRGEVLDILGV